MCLNRRINHTFKSSNKNRNLLDTFHTHIFLIPGLFHFLNKNHITHYFCLFGRSLHFLALYIFASYSHNWIYIILFRFCFLRKLKLFRCFSLSLFRNFFNFFLNISYTLSRNHLEFCYCF